MVHLAGINKGPILNWTDENGLMECFRKWRKKVEILFKGPLDMANDTVKCNYIIYWSGDTGMELVENGKLKENSKMEIGTLLTGTLICLKNIFLPSLIL